MIEVNYGQLPEQCFQRYFQYMIGKIYKILPMKEEGCTTLIQYLESLKAELIGSYELYLKLIDEPQFMTVLNIVQFLISAEYDEKTCKREVFKAIDVLDNLNKKYFEKG